MLNSPNDSREKSSDSLQPPTILILPGVPTNINSLAVNLEEQCFEPIAVDAE
jgi:hypothetical protein